MTEGTVTGPRTPDNEGIAALQAHTRALEAELARLHARQGVLASGISHDLRAPLRAIDGFAMQLQRRLDVEDTESAAQVVRIRAAVGRMAGLLDSLIAWSRLGQAELRLQPVDLTHLAEWALMDLQGAHPQLEIDAEVQAGLAVCGDERMLRQLLDAVFDNSRRFAAPGQPVRLEVVGEPVDGGLQLRVIDAGIGMELRDPTQPFAPFQRLHAASQGAGDGIGLAIVQLVAERHGGRVAIDSSPGQGTTLHVYLPAPAGTGVSTL